VSAGFLACCDLGRSRTFNRLIRSQVLYPIELQGHFVLSNYTPFKGMQR
jgi:hypothetical protein